MSAGTVSVDLRADGWERCQRDRVFAFARGTAVVDGKGTAVVDGKGTAVVDGKGTAVVDGNRLDAAALAERFLVAVGSAAHGDHLQAAADLADSLDGFFAAVVRTPTRTILVADGARTIPLYYAPAAGVVSDRGRIVREKTGADRDPDAEREFLLTRYVTGPETIWEGVLSTQAGEVALIRDRSGQPSVERRTYREYWPTGGATDPEKTLRDGFDAAMDRLELVADNRPIAVPLSGGFDSRLIAAELVARGRDVIGFTFGRPGHPDVEVSREVADRLGIRWEFVEYTMDDWRTWYHSERMKTYRRDAMADALPFLAEWPAVHRLVDEGRVPADTLFCPGHTVATPSERLPRFVGEADGGVRSVGCGPDVDAGQEASGADDRETITPTIDGLVDYVLDTHYTLWDWVDPAFRDVAADRVRRGLFGDHLPSGDLDPATAAAAYERWEWRGRMTTFTNGDLRVYEDAGVDWWLPLWDPAYVSAWSRIPHHHRRGKGLHADLAVERYREVADVPSARASVTDRTLDPVDRLLSRIRHTPARQFFEERENTDSERNVPTNHGGKAGPRPDSDVGRWDPSFQAPRSTWGRRGNHPLAWDGAVHPDIDAHVPPGRNFYALRVLAETDRLDLGDPQSGAEIPTDGVLDVPTVAGEEADDTSHE